VFKNVRTEKKIDIGTIPQFAETVTKLEKKLGKTCRILVRPSGTEPAIRVMVEGRNEDQINEIADELCGMIKKSPATSDCRFLGRLATGIASR
jgi:phosphoglucosamine mutase